MPAHLENSAVATGLEKVNFHSNPQKCSNYHTIALISNASKVMLKILQAGFSGTWTVNFQMFKLVLEKAEEPGIKLPTSAGSWKKQESSRKTSISAWLTMPKPLTVWITINCGKFWKRWKYQTTLPASWDILCRPRSNRTGHGTTDWFQIGKGVCQSCTLSPCLFNLYIMWICITWWVHHEYNMSTSWVHHVKFQAGWSTSWNQVCR